MIENMLNKLRALLVLALNKHIAFSRQSMMQIVENEIDTLERHDDRYWDHDVQWNVTLMFLEDQATQYHNLTLKQWVWVRNTIWHSLNVLNRDHMKAGDPEFINYMYISREELLLVLRGAVEELKTDSFDPFIWGKRRKESARVHWRVRLDARLGFVANKLTFGLFYKQIADWFDNKYTKV